MSSKPLQVIVVGGSLGGLCAGLVLKRLGHTVRIFERNPAALLHDQGAGIVAGGDVQAFFRKHDSTERTLGVPLTLRHYLAKDGTQVYKQEALQYTTSWDLLYNVLRGNYDGTQTSYAEAPTPKAGEGTASYDYGHRVIDVQHGEDGKVEVQYEGGDGKRGVERADLLIAADGASSSVRKLFLPEVIRKYAGYVAWRGTVPESNASDAAKDTFVEKFAFFHTDGIQILAYTIPGPQGSLKTGERLINWVWYCNYAENSEELVALMTDIDGHRHHFTLPVGKMRDEIWKQQRKHAEETLPPQFSELVRKTKQPFVQAITDVVSSKNAFFGGKVLLIGDAVAGFRPHTAASTNQAAFDALKLEELMEGAINLQQWEDETMDYARYTQQRGVEMGQRSQFGKHPLAR